MTKERRTHSPEFKARVALEALKGIKPIHQIPSENEIHPVQVSQWKKELRERISELFERKNGRSKETEKEQRHIEQFKHRGAGDLVSFAQLCSQYERGGDDWRWPLGSISFS